MLFINVSLFHFYVRRWRFRVPILVHDGLDVEAVGGRGKVDTRWHSLWEVDRKRSIIHLYCIDHHNSPVLNTAGATFSHPLVSIQMEETSLQSIVLPAFSSQCTTSETLACGFNRFQPPLSSLILKSVQWIGIYYYLWFILKHFYLDV